MRPVLSIVIDRLITKIMIIINSSFQRVYSFDEDIDNCIFLKAINESKARKANKDVRYTLFMF